MQQGILFSPGTQRGLVPMWLGVSEKGVWAWQGADGS